MRLALVLLAVACTRPGEERALQDLDVGRAELAGTRVEIADGLAAVRALADRRVELWASAPAI